MLPLRCLFSLFLSIAMCLPVLADTQSISQKTAGTQKLDGFFPIAWDTKAGKLYLEIDSFGKDFLFLDSLPYGVGSNDLGLDRGQLGQGRVVRFYRSGPKVLLIERNLQYRSSSPHAEEQLDVSQSFAESVLWGFKVEAEDGDKVLVDATDFFLHDAHGVAERLQQSKQGSYRLDASRSAISMESTKNFPLNTEVESVLTFATDDPSHAKLVASVTPDAHAVTVHEHYSFIQLPDDGYKPRAFDPRAGYFDVSYRDYSAPLGQPMDIHFVARHHLQKKDPTAAMSEPVKPIVYYVDRGAPEPIRNALVEGASWWNQAFEAAGFKDAFQVKVLPEGADPMDVRYNTIQWVHRSTRGWSYGEAVTDPRTGEIIKGQVTLGSLRSRQDYLIAEALLSPYQQGKPVPDAMKEMVLARIRQLAAHEVGHTLGLAHNFAASSVAPGDSVMDYPHPWITLKPDGTPDLSHAYTTNIGAWDKVAIAYGYSDFPQGTDEHKALDAILRKATDAGQLFITDEDSRPLGSAHPHAHLWDNGADPADELNRILTVRAAALKRFGENAIQPGQPLAQLEDTLVPLYLLHRYQTEAASKEIGGLDYRYALRGDGQLITRDIPAAEQKKALDAVLHTLDPVALTLPQSLLNSLPPRPPGYPSNRESFPGRTGLTFDPQGAVESAAGLTAGLLFEPTRASRLVEEKLRDPSLPGLDDVIHRTLQQTWYAPPLSGSTLATQLTVEDVVLRHLLALAASQSASQEAAAVAEAEVDLLKTWIDGKVSVASDSSLLHAHWLGARNEIELFDKDHSKFAKVDGLETPPGQPIGDDEDF
ncbi:zinc-dependent metalloprotease [Acidobacterium sp. S8]|uniref:zinc-dependent metalloprotease n=1 Tax=Acidobacterium sp. S8 TaxID=1641854 RepID=UPI00131D6419|nr:zinc-dependent metalloprotease [Acidobacterium sp. S8]